MEPHLSRLMSTREDLLICEAADRALGMPCRDGCIKVLSGVVSGVDTPADAAEEERQSEQGTIDGLVDGAGETKLVAEPVDIQEWRAELVKQEHGAIEVDERTLQTPFLSATYWKAQNQWEQLT